MSVKIRQSNYELMRIISMLFIVLWHVIVHSGISYTTTGTIQTIIQLLLCIIIVHVNSFVLITGYFQYNKNFSFKKFFSTFNQSYFYKIIIPIILIILSIINVSKWNMIEIISPINIGYGYWFIDCYLALYLLSPFINKLIKNLDKKTLQSMIIILLFLFSILPFLTIQKMLPNTGYSIINFILLYIIGAYLHKFPITENFKFKKFSKTKIRYISLITIILCFLINFGLWKFAIHYEFTHNSGMHYISEMLNTNTLNYSNILVIIQTICYFIFFGTLKFQNKFINKLSPLVFGVYLIHDNKYIRQNIYNWLNITNPEIYSSFILFAYILFAVIIIYIICLIIEFIRQILFKQIHKIKIYQMIENKMHDFIYNLSIINTINQK